MKTKQSILFLATLCYTCLTICAQTTEDTKKTINKIKKSQSYLSAECTLPDKDEAMHTAKELLVGEINAWIKDKRNSQEIKNIVLQDINSCCEDIDMKRGSNIRAFVYVKKSDIVPIYGNGQIMLTDNEKGTDLTPLTEVAGGSINIENNSTKAVVEKQKTEKIEKTEKTEEKQENLQENGLDAILTAENMQQMKNVFTTLKEKNIIEYGVYKSNSNTDISDCHLIIYDRSGNIKAILNEGTDIRTNLKTNTPAQLTEYTGMGVYWFKLK